MSSSAFPGWYIEFQTALLRQAPRPGEIDQATAEGWTNNQKGLKKNLHGFILSPLTSLLRLVCLCYDTVIGDCDGSENLAEARGGIMGVHLTPGLELEKESEATRPVRVQVYELATHASDAEVYRSLNVDSLCLTQHQIRSFIDTYWGLISERTWTRFFFKQEDEYFVASVRSNGHQGESVVYIKCLLCSSDVYNPGSIAFVFPELRN